MGFISVYHCLVNSTLSGLASPLTHILILCVLWACLPQFDMNRCLCLEVCGRVYDSGPL
jgi:hypothetical protein